MLHCDSHIEVIKGNFSEFFEVEAIVALWDALLVGQGYGRLTFHKWCLHFAAKIFDFKLSSIAINDQFDLVPLCWFDAPQALSLSLTLRHTFKSLRLL